jgi:hypothetical protein
MAYQVGDGNSGETMNVGRAGVPVQIGGTGGTVGLFGATPVAKAAAITAVTNTASGTELATAINALRVALQNVGITA